MAKPDIQRAYITASGTLFRDDGKLGKPHCYNGDLCASMGQ